jgi:DNA (cytosine-5)-methyltransferase 1
LQDAERLQGFASNWTAEVENTAGLKKNARWRLIGNAVNTGMSHWLAGRFKDPIKFTGESVPMIEGGRWPKAAWGKKGKSYSVDLSSWPELPVSSNLSIFLNDPLKPLSVRATSGFLNRATGCNNIVYSSRFLASLQSHIDTFK